MPQKKAIRVLVAEDHPGVLQTVCWMLELNGYSVSTAIDDREALLNLHLHAPDLLLFNLEISAFSDFDLLALVRRLFPEIVVVATSGAYSSGPVPSGVLADAFYAKGGDDPKALLNIIARALRVSPARDIAAKAAAVATLAHACSLR